MIDAGAIERAEKHLKIAGDLGGMRLVHAESGVDSDAMGHFIKACRDLYEASPQTEVLDTILAHAFMVGSVSQRIEMRDLEVVEK